MKVKKVIVTIAIGDMHYNFWKKYASKSWELYAEKHGYDIICFQEPLDNSERAKKRSVSWQKCLILNDPKVKQYDRVVWLDSDIIINHFDAPCIVSTVKEDAIGVVNAWEFSEVNYHFLQKRMINYCKRHRLPYYNIGKQYFIDYGLPAVSDKAVQGGVLVLNPSHHSKIMEAVYFNYEDNRPAYWHYEMRPISFEIISSNLCQWIDNRFNYVVENLKLTRYYHRYPQNYYERVLRILTIKLYKLLSLLGFRFWQEDLVNEALLEGYFIHFAGNAKEMVFVERLLAQNN